MSEFVNQTQKEETVEQEASEQVSKKMPKRGEMIAVCSAKGGVGRTVMTANLAVALSKKNMSVSVLDGDFQFGDMCLAMDLQPSFTMKDLVDEQDQLDEYLVSSFLNHHESGVKVLAAPERPEYADMITPAVVDQVSHHLMAEYDYLLVDTEVGLTSQSLQFVQKADQILLLTDLEMSTLKNTKLFLETLEALDLRSKVEVVVNRSSMESVISADDVPQILGEEILYYIPNHYQTVSQSLNIGVPFVMNHANSDLAKSIFKMAEQLTTRRTIRPLTNDKPSFFKSLFNKARQLKEGTE